MVDDLDDHVGNGSLTKIKRASTGFVQQSVQCGKGFSGAEGGFREEAIRWKAVIQTPREENWLIDSIEVRESAAVERHEAIVDG
jgi:hypothetical protein